MKILVVDDSAIMRRLIAKQLNAHGYDDIVEAGDGAEAISKLEGIDLILTDWNMPVMNGLEFVKAVRAIPAMGNVPIMMITTEGARDEVIEALKSGVNEYLVKPFTSPDLLDKVKKLINE